MRTLLAAACALLFIGSAAGAGSPPEEWDGLRKTQVKEIDLAYVRPGVDMSVYGKVMLDPVHVAFAKDWDPERAGTRFPLSQEEREKIRQGLAELFMKTFAETLSEKDGYPVVTQPGPDTMRVQTALIDVYVNAPDTMTASRTRTYAVNAGRMTLVAELRDSETGALFARVADAREARDNIGLTWSTSVENVGEARSIIKRWASILRSRMDAVRKSSTADADGK